MGGRVLLPCLANPGSFVGWSHSPDESSARTVIQNSDEIQIEEAGLVIPVSSQSDGGFYVCHAVNSEGSIEHVANVVINAPPQILPRGAERAREVKGFVGGKVSFPCVVQGSPRPEIKWWKDGVQVLTNEKKARITISDKNGRVKTSSILRISPTQPEDAGRYECRAENVFGSAVKEITLALVPPTPPSITYVPEMLSVPSESTVNIRCVAEGRPPPQIRWTKAGKKLRLGDRFQAKNGYLAIEQVQPDDSGFYGCWAFNLGGRTVKRVKLTVWDERVERVEASRLIGQENNGEPRAPPVDRRIEHAINLAKFNVMTSVNRTIDRLREHRTSTHVPVRNLFALGKFPPRRSRAMAVAAEIFEEAVRIAQAEIGAIQSDPLSHDALGRTADMLTRDQLERLRVLAGCDAHRQQPDCDADFCFHKQYRSADG